MVIVNSSYYGNVGLSHRPGRVEGGCGRLVGSDGFGELGQAMVVVVGMFDSGQVRSLGVVLGRYHVTVLCRRNYPVLFRVQRRRSCRRR